MIEHDYGKEVMKLAGRWRDDGFPDHEERRARYLADREAVYQTIAKAYTDAGLAAPPRTILSGRP